MENTKAFDSCINLKAFCNSFILASKAKIIKSWGLLAAGFQVIILEKLRSCGLIISICMNHKLKMLVQFLLFDRHSIGKEEMTTQVGLNTFVARRGKKVGGKKLFTKKCNFSPKIKPLVRFCAL